MQGKLRSTGQIRGIASANKRRDILLLLVGFLAATAAILVAHRSPATAYELSIYKATPLVFWVGIAIAIACAMIVAFGKSTKGLRAGAAVLASEAFLAIVSLPILRGYEFYSAGDALSHMGWIRNVLAGQMALTELIYPGTHTVSIFYHQLLGLPLEHAMQLSVVTFAAMFIVFIPALVCVLTDDRGTASLSLFAAMMILPINNISAHLAFFPSTMAIFLLPFVLLLATVALTDSAGSWLTPVDGLLGLGAISILLVHPQQAVNLLLVFVTVSVAVIAYRYRSGDRSLNPLYGHTNLLAIAIVVWGVSHERITEAATAFSGSIVSTLLTGSPSGGSAIAQRTGSLSAIGSSPLEIGLKLFLPSAIFSILAMALVTKAVLKLIRSGYDRREIAFIGLGLVPVGVVMILYIVANLQTIYFRHLGFIMALVTVLGAIAYARGLDWATDRGLRQSVTAVGGVALAALLVLSLVTVFPSPFIYQPNSQVTESRMAGHATAFAHENESIEYVGLRTGPDRFKDAIEGTGELQSRSVRRSSRVPYGNLTSDLTRVFNDSTYFVVSDADVQREDGAYKNLRYSDRGLQNIGDSSGVDHVVSNGGFELYYIDE